MLETLRQLDHELFTFLNSHHTAVLDPVMVLISERFFWFPAYAVLLVYLIYTFRRKGIAKLFLILSAVAAADIISSRLFKPAFARLRPCHDPTLSETINIVSGCGGQFGFISSHAATTFALAVFMYLVLPSNYRWFKITLLVWAAVVSYSRIYLGVHFPGDVFAGVLLGSFLAGLAALLYKKMLAKYPYFHR